MFGFLSKKRGLGIEITEKYIRFCEIEKNGDFLSLRRFGRLSIPVGVFSGTNIENPHMLSELVQSILNDSKSKVVRIVLPGESQKFFNLLVPKSSSGEIIEHVIHGLKENVSFNEGQDEVVDIHILAKEDKVLSVRAATATREFKHNYTPVLHIFERYDAHIERANQAALVAFAGEDSGSSIHVQFGDMFTSISIISGSRVVEYQEIPFSTYRFLLEVQKKLTKPSHTTSNYLTTLGVYGADVRDFAEQAIAPLGIVIDHAISNFSQKQNSTIGKITLGGAFAGYKGVSDMLSRYVRAEVSPAYPWHPFDPRFDETIYQMKKSETLEYLVTLGLAIECVE